MSTRGILAMVAGIVVIHLLVLYFVVREPDGGTQPGRTQQSGDSVISDAAVRDDSPGSAERGGIFVPPSGGSAEPGKPARRHASGKRYSGQPAALNGRGAVVGEIPGTKKKSILRTANIRAGILVDLDSRKILWQKNPDTAVSIASLSKIMTLLLAYEAALPGGSYALDDMIVVTPEAQSIPPSGVALRRGENFPYEKLILAAAVKSANDAAYLLAQTVGGSEQKFVAMMNDRARELGMTETRFFNSHGLPGQTGKLDNKSSVRDIVILSEAYMSYPELMNWSGMRVAQFRTNGDLRTHNNLLPGAGARTPCKGVIGIKTGFTQRAGSCVSALCVRGNRRLLAVVTGCNGSRERDTFVRELFEWGFKR